MTATEEPPGNKNKDSFDITDYFSKAISWLWFWLWNWPLLPNKSEAKVIRDMQRINFDETKNWYYLSVLLNLFPFVFSFAIEFVYNNQNILCLLNNGSLPILAYSLLATNFFYLLENIPDSDSSKSFRNVKTRIYVLAVLTMFISAVLYVFQSNFLGGFKSEHLKLSLEASALMLLMSILWGSKMYLLQNKKIEDYGLLIAAEKKKLTQQNSNEYQQ